MKIFAWAIVEIRTSLNKLYKGRRANSDSLKNFSTEVDGEVLKTWRFWYKSIKNYLRYNEKRVKVVLQ